MLRCVACAVLLVAGLPAAAQTVSKDPGHAPAGLYRLETAHSQILFSIAHLGLTDYYGRFDRVSGTLNFDAGTPQNSSVDITIAAASIDTPSARLNEALRGPDVFAVDHFPDASFKSLRIERTGADTGRIAGLLTIRGIARPVTLDTVFSGGEFDPLGHGYALGFHATATIKRSDYAMAGMAWSPLVGDDVHVIVEAMFEYEKDGS